MKVGELKNWALIEDNRCVILRCLSPQNAMPSFQREHPLDLPAGDRPPDSGVQHERRKRPQEVMDGERHVLGRGWYESFSGHNPVVTFRQSIYESRFS